MNYRIIQALQIIIKVLFAISRFLNKIQAQLLCKELITKSPEVQRETMKIMNSGA